MIKYCFQYLYNLRVAQTSSLTSGLAKLLVSVQTQANKAVKLPLKPLAMHKEEKACKERLPQAKVVKVSTTKAAQAQAPAETSI